MIDPIGAIRKIYSRIGAPAGASVSADILAVAGQATAAAAYAILNSGLSFRAVVTSKAGCGVTEFICDSLLGVGTGAFVDATAPYRCFVLMKGDGTMTSPHGETQNVTVYDSATGKFTTAAFGAEIVVGDTVILMHPRLAELAAIRALVDARVAGRTQIFRKYVTNALINGTQDIVMATATTHPVLIKGVVVRAWGVPTADLVSIAVYGEAAKAVTFIDPVLGVRANLIAAGKQVASPSGEIASIDTGQTIVMTQVGTGVNALDMWIEIEYEALVDGGYLV